LLFITNSNLVTYEDAIPSTQIDASGNRDADTRRLFPLINPVITEVTLLLWLDIKVKDP
jgi:hypothetical protein